MGRDRRRAMRSRSTGIFVVVILFWGSALDTRDAQAQALSAEEKKRMSKEYFDRGMELKETDPKTAIELFKLSAETYSGDSETKMATCFQMAESHRKLGETASAWKNYTCAAETAKGEGWTQDARDAQWYADGLKPKLCRLKVKMPMEELDKGLTLKVNGEPWVFWKWGREEPVDPGVHDIEVSAPGYEPFKATLMVSKAGEIRTLYVPPLKGSIPWLGVGILSGGALGIGIGIWLAVSRSDADRSALGAEIASFTVGIPLFAAGGYLVGDHYKWWGTANSKSQPANSSVQSLQLYAGPPGTWLGLGVGTSF